MSPVAVLTDHQGKGVGQRLIRFGISHLKSEGARVLFTYGNPEYYARVGFRQIGEDIARAPVELTMPFGWLGQSLTDGGLGPLVGESRCVEALDNLEYW